MEFPVKLARPALRALEGAGIRRLEDFRKFTEGQVMEFHGMGPNAMGKLKVAMATAGIDFMRENR